MKKLLFLIFIIVLNVFENLSAQNCSDNIIYVDKNRIPNIVDWKKANDQFTCDEINTTITIDLSLLVKNDVPQWLRNNSAYIDFKKSYKPIEEIHRVLDASIIDLAEKKFVSGDSKEFTYDELIYYLDDYYNIDMITQSEYYKNYKGIKRTFLFGNVKVFSLDGFKDDTFCFSAPLFKSIIDLYVASKYPNIDVSTKYKECKFNFTIISNEKKNDMAVMKFTFENNNYYYDFSDEPGKAKILQLKNGNKDLLEKSIKKILKKYL